jgi:hypothetical protein
LGGVNEVVICVNLNGDDLAFSKSGGVVEWGNMRKERRKVGGGSLREL